MIPLDAGHQIRFLDRQSGSQAIVDETQDPFFRELSRIDLETRLGQSLEGVPRGQAIGRLKQLFQSAVVDWSPAEIDAVTQSCRRIFAQAQATMPGFVPHDWKFVKTSGVEEGGAAYTRGDTVILSTQKFARPSGMTHLVSHETCHVYGRLHPRTRKELLARLGFQVVGPVDLGDGLGPRRLTNPDSPVVDSVIRVKTGDDVEFDAAMVLYADPPQFDPFKGRGVFPYLKYGLVPVADDGRGGYQVATTGPKMPMVYRPEQVTGFFEQAGRNTAYILSPDEILAENVALGFAEGGQGQGAIDPTIPADLAKIIAKSMENTGADSVTNPDS